MNSEIEKAEFVRGTRIQSVLLSKRRFKSAQAARKWARSRGFRASDLDETEQYYRFRQREPGHFDRSTFRTIVLTDGVKAVIGVPKKGKGRMKKDAMQVLDEFIKACRPQDTSVILEKAYADALLLLEKLDTVVPMPGAEGVGGFVAGQAGAGAGAVMLPSYEEGQEEMAQQQHKDSPDVTQLQEPKVTVNDFMGYLYGAIMDEVKAVSVYDTLARVAPDEKARALMIHIRDEEIDHINELKVLVANLQKNRGVSGVKSFSLGAPDRSV